MGDSIMRPPVGKKNMPPRITDAPNRTDQVLGRWRWAENGRAWNTQNPDYVILPPTGTQLWVVLYKLEPVAEVPDRFRAAWYPYKSGARR